MWTVSFDPFSFIANDGELSTCRVCRVHVSCCSPSIYIFLGLRTLPSMWSTRPSTEKEGETVCWGNIKWKVSKTSCKLSAVRLSSLNVRLPKHNQTQSKARPLLISPSSLDHHLPVKVPPMMAMREVRNSYHARFLELMTVARGEMS